MLIRKYYDVSVWSKSRNCSAMKGVYPIMKDSIHIVVMKVMVWSETC